MILRKVMEFCIVFLLYFITHVYAIYLEKYYDNLVINYTYKNFYTGYVDGKLFLAKNLFSKNYNLLVSNTYNFSEGIYINQKSENEYLLLANTNSFYNLFSLLVINFDKDLNILGTKLCRTDRDYFLIEANEYYQDYQKRIFLVGLLKNVFDVDLVLTNFPYQEINSNFSVFSISFGTKNFDYPIYFSEYQDENFKGYLMISIIDRNNYKDFMDFRFAIQSKRFNSDSIFVCFIQEDLSKGFKISKYYALRFPRNIVDYSIIRKAIDSVLIRVDFIDRISGYYMSTNFINIDFTKAIVTGANYDTFNQFYQDTFVDLKSNNFKFRLNDINFYFAKGKLRR